MKKLITLLILIFTILYSYSLTAQEYFSKSKPTIERGKITIKLKESTNRLQKQKGNAVTFGISSLDQKMQKYKVFSLKKRFNHKPIAKSSGLPDLSRIYQIEFPAEYDVAAVVQEFSADPYIEYAEPVPIYYLMGIPNDSLYKQQWYLKKIQAEQAWDIHKGEDGDSIVILSITDSGCKYDHLDLAQNIWNNLGEDADGDGKTFEFKNSAWGLDQDDINNIDDDGNGYVDDLIGWNFDSNNNSPIDEEGHGTLVSGIAAAVTNNITGIASISYNLKLMPVKGYFDGLIYAAENGADVINCSWGGIQFSKADKEVIDYASGLGSIIVVAAGNDNSSNPLYPALYPSVICVAGVDSQDVRVSYSTYGAGVDVVTPAPSEGQPIISTTKDNSYFGITIGTSACAPIVTGLTGLIKSFHPDWTNDQIVKQLLYTTDNISSVNPGFENFLGTGRINAYRALTDSNLTITPELKINTALLKITKPVNQDSAISLSFMVQNYSHFLDANPLNINLTSNNPDVQIINGSYSGFVAANSITDLIDIFKIKFAPDATSETASFECNISADLPVVAGALFKFNLTLNAGGPVVLDSYNVTRIDSSRIYLHDIFITNKGQIRMSSLSGQVKSVDSSAVSNDHRQSLGSLNPQATMKMPGGYFFDISKTTSDSIELVLEVSNGVNSWNNRFNVKIPPLSGIKGLTTVMLDEANNLDNWTSTGWGIITGKSVSPPSSFTDSPSGYYSSNSTTTLVYNNPIKCLNAIFAFLEFDSRWEIEDDWDYGQVQLSTNNGSTLISLAGQYTNLGTGNFQPNGAPLYDGYQYMWIHEMIDITDYLGYPLKLRFLFKTDQQFNFDGWYIDNVKISVYASQLAEQPYIDKTYAKLGADSVLFSIKFINLFNTQFTSNLIYHDLEGGEIDSLILYDDGLHGDLLADDNVYGNYILAKPAEGFYSIGISTIDHQINKYIYTQDICRFTTAGPLLIDSIAYSTLSNFRYNVKPFIKNEGSTVPINNIHVKIFSNDSWVIKVFPESQACSNISPGEIKTVSRNFVVSYDSSTFPGYFNLKFEIMSDGWTYWTDSLHVIISPTGIDEQTNQPLTFKLEQNYPNPLNPTTNIQYSIASRQFVVLKIYNVLGQEIETLINEEKPAGNHQIEFNAANLPSGVYFYKIRAGSFSQVKKMLLIK